MKRHHRPNQSRSYRRRLSSVLGNAVRSRSAMTTLPRRALTRHRREHAAACGRRQHAPRSRLRRAQPARRGDRCGALGPLPALGTPAAVDQTAIGGGGGRRARRRQAAEYAQQTRARRAWPPDWPWGRWPPASSRTPGKHLGFRPPPSEHRARPSRPSSAMTCGRESPTMRRTRLSPSSKTPWRSGWRPWAPRADVPSRGTPPPRASQLGRTGDSYRGTLRRERAAEPSRSRTMHVGHFDPDHRHLGELVREHLVERSHPDAVPDHRRVVDPLRRERATGTITPSC